MNIPIFDTFFEGFTLYLGLIITIGIQNAYVLKQSILKNHHYLIAFYCALLDSIMIFIGAYGFTKILIRSPDLVKASGYLAVIFIFGYALYSFYSSFKNQSLEIENTKKNDKLKTIFLQIFVVSVLNPNAIIDSILLTGSVSAQYSTQEVLPFALGACSASFAWFFLLAYSSSFLVPFFKKPNSWKILDFIVGLTMLFIAYSIFNKLHLKI